MRKLLITLLALFPATLSATPIMGVATLPLSTSLITFNGAPLANGDAVTDQFIGEGATFSGLFFSSTGFTPRANTDGALLFRFGRGVTVGISFEELVGDAFFALGSNGGTATFTSRLAGNIVESFTADISNTALPVSNSQARPNVFGFTDSLFDEILFTTSAGSTGLTLDNVGFSTAEVMVPVPVPASLALIVCGLVSLRFARRRC